MATLSFDVFWKDHGAKAGLKGLSAESREAAKRQAEFRQTAVVAGAAVGAALWKIGKDSLKVASDIGESQSKVQVVFGKSARVVEDLGETSAKSLGISKAAALEAAGVFGNLFVSLKLPQSEAAKMSTRMVQLSADMASFNNSTPEEALEALRAGLVGETEPLRRFGVNINDAALRQKALDLGLVKTTKDTLPASAKAQASYALILEQTTTAQGDFARTSGGLANQQRILKAEFSDLQGELGAKLLPAVVATTGGLVEMLEFVDEHGRVITVAAAGIGAFATSVWGINKAAAGFKATSAAWETLTASVAGFNREGSRTSRALGAVGGAGGALGLVGGALTIGAVAWGIYAKRQGEARERADRLRDSLDRQTGALTANSREASYANLQQLGAIEAAKKLGLNLQDVTDAALGNAAAQARVNAALAEADRQMSGYSVTTGRGASAQRTLSGDVVKVRTALDDQNQELARQRSELADARAAGVGAAEATDDLTAATEANTDALGENVEKLDRRSALLSRRSAERDFEQAIDDLTESVKENGKTLNTNTEKGRANAEAMDRLAEMADAYKKAIKDAGGGTKEMNAVQQEAYKKLVATGTALFGSKRKAEDYARAVLGIPKKADTKVNTDTKRATEKIIDFERRLANMRGKTVTVGAELRFPKGWAEYRAGERKAFGGRIGDGTGTVDEVPILAMRGEHMWTTREVSAAGGHGAMHRLRAAALRGDLKGYASGGAIGMSAAAGIGRLESNLEYLAIKFGRDLQKQIGALGGGSIGGIGWARQWAVLRAAFPGASLFSAYRPGAITASGNTSWHARGRAIDVTPSMAIFDWWRRNYGRNTKELIYSPAGGRQIKNGRPHFYGQPVRGMHWDHVHIAYDEGGLARGAGLIAKGPAPERVLSPRQTSAFEHLVRGLDRGRGGHGPVNINLHAPNYVGSHDQLLSALTLDARTGRLATVLRAAGLNV